MAGLISWIPLKTLNLPDEIVTRFRVFPVPKTRDLAGVWVGTNTYDVKQMFALQLHVGKNDPKDRMAALVSESLGEDGERIPRGISEDHVADAAGLLGFKYYDWLPFGPAAVVINENWPPDAGPPPPEELPPGWDEM